MKKKNIISSLVLVFIAMLWGGSFVAQSSGGSIIGPFSFGFIRFFIAGVAILPVAKLIDDKSAKKSPSQDKKALIKGGLLCGVFLASTSLFQQLGMFMGTPSGKAGFLTACYIVVVPIIGLFFKKKCDFNVWIAVALTLIGLYMLCIKNGFNMQISDLVVILCSIGIASRIQIIDRINDRVTPARLACIQFFTASLILGVITAIFEIEHSPSGLAQWWQTVNQWAVWSSLLYTGVLAGTVAFTLQIVAQKNVNPTIASLLMSLESVFSVLAGWMILGDKLSAKELLGCGVIFIALVIAQLPIKQMLNGKKHST